MRSAWKEPSSRAAGEGLLRGRAVGRLDGLLDGAEGGQLAERALAVLELGQDAVDVGRHARGARGGERLLVHQVDELGDGRELVPDGLEPVARPRPALGAAVGDGEPAAEQPARRGGGRRLGGLERADGALERVRLVIASDSSQARWSMARRM